MASHVHRYEKSGGYVVSVEEEDVTRTVEIVLERLLELQIISMSDLPFGFTGSHTDKDGRTYPFL